MDKIQLVKREIERRYKELDAQYAKTASTYVEGMMDALDHIESFIDSLPDEYQPNLDLIKKSWYTEGYMDALYHLEPIWIIRDLKYVENPKCGQPLPDEPKAEQPVTDCHELDNHTIMEEIRKCGCNPNEFDVARHFYELGCTRTAVMYDDVEYERQRAEEAEISKGLEEEIDRYWKEEMPVVTESDLNDIARHFAEWGAEHLKK